MDMNPGGAAFKQVRKCFHVNLGIGTDWPTLRHFFEWNFSFGAVLNSLRDREY